MTMAACSVMLTCSAVYAQQTAAPLLHTTVAQGEIEGEEVEGFALYRAIPYAEAPVGSLRWKAPVPKTHWDGVLKATEWAHRPHQHADDGKVADMDEDCLYLSIMTPAKSTDERLPVFVMIHGGAFQSGSYSGMQTNFVSEGIIYCSIEYRLGVLGFLAHPELEKESADGTSGNYGILDQICALQWIHDNIDRFGGDPDRITICGESAGGISVSILCASPMCKGLFSGAISESGGSFCAVADKATGMSSAPKRCHAAAQEGLAYQQQLKCKNLKQLRKMSAQTLTEAPVAEMFWPVMDGHAIADDQYTLYEQGRYNDVNVLIGYNSDEGSLFMHEMTLGGYDSAITAQYGDWADRVKAVYPAASDEEALWAMQDIFRDNAFGYSTWAWANLQSRTGKGKVYMYYFDQASQNSLVKNSRGATHVAEMPFVYDWHWGEMTETEVHMGNIMRQYWINFIKYGNPNGALLPYWPVYAEGKATVMGMHEGFEVIEAPNQKQMELFEAYFKSIRQR